MLISKTLSIIFLLTLAGAIAGVVFLDWSIATPIFILFAFVLTKIYGSVFISSNFYIETLCNGNQNENSIAITFDDGPVIGKTDRILEILREKNVKATFFCIGKNVVSSESLLKKIDDEGHLIGNHSFEHGRWFDLQSSLKMSDELTKTTNAIANVINKKPKLFRPPYGVTNPNLARAVRAGDYQTIGWNVRSFDTASEGKEKLWKRITKKIKGGDIILFHDRSENTIELLPDFIDHVSEIGLRIVLLDQLLKVKPYA